MAGINDRRSDEIWARVTTSMIQHKAVGLRPMIVGTITPPHNLLEVFDNSKDDDTGVVKEGDDDDDVQEVGPGVELGAGDGSNKEAGGGAGAGAASHLLLTSPVVAVAYEFIRACSPPLRPPSGPYSVCL